MADLLKWNHATVTSCHSKTQNLQQIVSHIEQYYKANVSF